MARRPGESIQYWLRGAVPNPAIMQVSHLRRKEIMTAKKILFCTDFSHVSDAALPLATSLAHNRGASLVILHVHEPPLPSAYAVLSGVIEPDRDALKRVLQRVASADPTVRCTHELAFGDPATEIVRVAEQEGVDMIVIGSHGRTGLPRMLMGSVAEKVLRRARCPIVIFKQANKVESAD